MAIVPGGGCEATKGGLHLGEQAHSSVAANALAQSVHRDYRGADQHSRSICSNSAHELRAAWQHEGTQPPRQAHTCIWSHDDRCCELPPVWGKAMSPLEGLAVRGDEHLVGVGPCQHGLCRLCLEHQVHPK